MNSCLVFRMTIRYTVYIFLWKSGLFVMRIAIGIILVLLAGILVFIGARNLEEYEAPLPGLMLGIGVLFLYIASRLFF